MHKQIRKKEETRYFALIFLLANRYKLLRHHILKQIKIQIILGFLFRDDSPCNATN